MSWSSSGPPASPPKNPANRWWIWLLASPLVCCGGVLGVGLVGNESDQPPEPGVVTTALSSPSSPAPPASKGSKEKAILGGALEDFDARLGPPAPPNLRPQIAHYVSCTPASPRWSIIFQGREATQISVAYCQGEPVPNETIMVGEARSFMPPDAKPVQQTSNRSGDRVRVFESSIAAQQRPTPSVDCTGAAAPPGRISLALYPPGSPTGEPGWGLKHGGCA